MINRCHWPSSGRRKWKRKHQQHRHGRKRRKTSTSFDRPVKSAFAFASAFASAFAFAFAIEFNSIQFEPNQTKPIELDRIGSNRIEANFLQATKTARTTPDLIRYKSDLAIRVVHFRFRFRSSRVEIAPLIINMKSITCNSEAGQTCAFGPPNKSESFRTRACVALFRLRDAGRNYDHTSGLNFGPNSRRPKTRLKAHATSRVSMQIRL